MTNDSSKNPEKISSKKAEALANRLVKKYETDEYRKWYLRLIYSLGVDTVNALEKKADKDGKTPSRLFSFLAKEKLDELNDKN